MRAEQPIIIRLPVKEEKLASLSLKWYMGAGRAVCSPE